VLKFSKRPTIHIMAIKLDKSVAIIKEGIRTGQVQDHFEFDPAALKNKYLEERDKRLRANTEGVGQYRLIEGSLTHYIEDPYIGEIIKRSPVQEECQVVIIGGGYGGQLVAVRLIEAGIKNIRIIEKGGGFGGTW